MTVVGLATKAMFNLIAHDTYERAKEWFKEHPDVMFAYWAKDDFLSCEASEDSQECFLKAHPEIEDISDHTIVCFGNDTLSLFHFCPRLMNGIKDFYESGYCCGDGWTVEPDPSILGNYIVKVTC